MIEIFEKQVGEHTYKIPMLPATKAIEIQLKLMSFLGEAFCNLAIKMKDDVKEGGLSAKDVGQIISILAPCIGDDDFKKLMFRCLEDVIIVDPKNGINDTRGTPRKVNVDLDFRGKLNDFYIVLYHVLEVNYKDFLLTILSGLKSLGMLKATA